MLGDTSECPRYHLASAAQSFGRVADAYCAGHLPVAGGSLDQPVRLLSLLELYRNGVA